MKGWGKGKYGLVILALIWGLIAKAKEELAPLSFFSQTSVGAFVNNPANYINAQWDGIAINPLSSVNVEMQLPYSLHQVFSKTGTNNPYLLDFEKLAHKASPNNAFFMNTSFTWLSVSGGSEYRRWNFSIQDQVMAGLGFQDKFIELLNLGNKPFIGQTVELKFPINELHFRSYQFSVAKKINDKLVVGITSKLYFGKSWIDAKSAFSLFTYDEGKQVDLGVEGRGRASLPVTLESVLNKSTNQSTFSNYLFGMNNPGIGLDVGVIYRMNKKIQVSASATNMGFIVWNANTTTFKASGLYNWQGIELSGKFDFNQLSGLNEHPTIVSFRDSFLNQLLVPKDQHFITTAPMAFCAGFNYKYKPTIELEVLSRVLFYGHFIRGYLTLNGAMSLKENWKLNAGLMFTNHSYFNLPAGIAYQGRKIKMAFMVNNLFGVMAPELSKTFGGSITLTYRFVRHALIKDPGHYPFFQKNSNKAVKLLIF